MTCRFRTTSYDVVSIDWTINPIEARKIIEAISDSKQDGNNQSISGKETPTVLQVLRNTHLNSPYYNKKIA